MLKSNLILATSLALSMSAALADPGDIHINDWPGASSSPAQAQIVSAFAGGAVRGVSSSADGDYPGAFSSAPCSRDQVVGELREAQRLGLTSGGEGDVPVATVEQEQLIVAAGKKAAESLMVARPAQ